MNTHRRRLAAALACAAALLLLTSPAAAEPPQHRGPWSVRDVMGRPFASQQAQGRLLIVFVMTADQKGQARPLYEQLILRFGDDSRLAQLSLLDLRDAPTTWRAAETVADTVTERVQEVHTWTVQHLRDLLKAEGKPDIPDLDKRVHIALDWDGSLARRFGLDKPPAQPAILLSTPGGDLLGPFSPDQSAALIQAIEAALP